MADPQRVPDSNRQVYRADVGIIGAGPAGLATAIHLGQLGIDRVIIADRSQFPRDKTCGSAVSPRGREVLGALGVSKAVIQEAYPISGLRLVTPRLHQLTVSSPEDAALICSRRTLDNLMLRRAQETGGEFVPNFHVRFLLQQGDRVMGFRGADGREVHAAYTVVSDGAHSEFAIERGSRRLLQAIMGWWEDVPFRANHIEMIFDKLVEPHYGWLFPEGPARVNIGICYEDPDLAKNARQLFEDFLHKHYVARLANARQVGTWKGHPISYSATIRKLTSPGRIVVGEAGRITHPATAEGIYRAPHIARNLPASRSCGKLHNCTKPGRTADERAPQACRHPGRRYRRLQPADGRR